MKYFQDFTSSAASAKDDMHRISSSLILFFVYFVRNILYLYYIYSVLKVTFADNQTVTEAISGNDLKMIRKPFENDLKMFLKLLPHKSTPDALPGRHEVCMIFSYRSYGFILYRRSSVQRVTFTGTQRNEAQGTDNLRARHTERAFLLY